MTVSGIGNRESGVANRESGVGSQDSGAEGTIEVRGFSFSYGPRQALKDISFTIPARSVTAIIGPSGCGKSTFLRSINRLNDLIPEAHYAGDIRVHGRSVFGSGSDLVALRQKVGMVFQRPNRGSMGCCRRGTCPHWSSAACARPRCGRR